MERDDFRADRQRLWICELFPAAGTDGGHHRPAVVRRFAARRGNSAAWTLCAGRCQFRPAVHDRGRPRSGFDESHCREA